MIEKRERIEKLVEKIEYRTLGDICADHCYISILALMSDKVDFVIASDLNKAPLEIGKANIIECGFENNVETRLGSGIDTIESGEVETLIIAGIGGNLMLNLLKQNEHKLSSYKQLILQPQNEEIEMRKYVHSIGFIIKSETYVYEKGMRYIILNCINKDEDKVRDSVYTEEDYVLGKYVDEECRDTYYDYIKHRYEVTLGLKVKLDKLENKEKLEKYQKANKHIEVYEKFLQSNNQCNIMR